MRDGNKEFFKQNLFTDRVEGTMTRRNIDYDQLSELLNEEIKYGIAKGNLRMYITQRTPNVNFLIALSKALRVSTDYLLGESDDELPEGINHRIHSRMYTKYNGSFNLFFYETIDNEMRAIEKPHTLEIDFKNNPPVKMTINTTEGGEKEYFGTLQISETTPNVFIILKSDFGEIVSMAFYDESMNVQDFKCAVGGMLSISAGDLKRAPVMNRFIITEYDVDADKMKFIQAHLKMNTKYINITEAMLEKSVREVLADKDENKSESDKTISDNKDYIDAEQIITRLKNAFYEKKYYAIEESFITNTIKKDSGLSTPQADELVAVMRNNSLGNINSKINKSLDSIVFRNTFSEKKKSQEKKSGENGSEDNNNL